MKNINNWINKIIKGDNVDVLKQIPDKSIDFIFADTPYVLWTEKYDLIFKEIINNIWKGGSYE